MSLEELFAEVKKTGNWEAIYEPLKAIAKKISGPNHEDVLHDVLAGVINKLDSVDSVGYLLQSIKNRAVKLKIRQRKHEFRLTEIWNKR